eukprot:49825-Prorocentrum_minimum.AAC.2
MIVLEKNRSTCPEQRAVSSEMIDIARTNTSGSYRNAKRAVYLSLIRNALEPVTRVARVSSSVFVKSENHRLDRLVSTP